MKQFDRRNFYLFLGMGFSLLLIIIAITIASQRSSFSSRASSGSNSSSLLSMENSYLFASPIAGEADGTSIIRVTAFLLNSQGLGVAGQKVELKTSSTTTISRIQPVTDTFGRAIFDLTSNKPGNYTISAEVGDLSLPQTVSISFH